MSVLCRTVKVEVSLTAMRDKCFIDSPPALTERYGESTAIIVL